MTRSHPYLKLFAAALLVTACADSEATEDNASEAVQAEQPAPEAPAAPEPEPEPEPAAPTPAPAAPARAPAPPPAAPPEAPPEPEEPREPRLTIPAETTLLFEVDEDLSTESNATGDEFTLSLAEDVLAADGSVLLAAGTPASGVITEAVQSSGSDQPAVLNVRVTGVIFEDALVMLSGDIIAVDIEGDAQDSRTETAAKIAGGAAAGAALGRLIGGDNRDAVVGAVAGAAAGTALWLVTRDGHAQLPRGTSLSFTLASPAVIY